ncbi:pyrroloquinoline quinone biosynthesis peptide chaperone PqqD [Thermomonospora umbrina]|uniref:Pyrroloquinoline quinone biosynthesis protein D n=1 Tax=Thermomonospora umbrina TaxID=111806 RepID=A0A3D9SNP3_9ACTN|nr:pyrroloquinoline quinone biosynthesis peptide chaperone PqqD [Thermomonospora umbrina]REE97596.1 pyrroloquinoline quinone biosynthesis protein D [Thermomonospora umbrina]
MSWRPALAPAVQLSHCPVREARLLIVPERIIVLNTQAAAIVDLCDGSRTDVEIVSAFPPEHAGEVSDFLADIREHGWLR